MNQFSRLYLLLAGSVLVFSGCTQAVGPTAEPAPTTPAKVETKAAWQTTWDELVAAAKKEGTVVAYGNQATNVRDTLAKAFKEKYGINMEWMAGRPAELIAKLKAERRAGMYLVDVGFNGGTTLTNEIKPMGISEPLEPLLVLPEVKDSKNWREGKLPFLDTSKEAFILAMLAPTPMRPNYF